MELNFFAPGLVLEKIEFENLLRTYATAAKKEFTVQRITHG